MKCCQKITFLVGLGKIFGRSAKNFGRLGQFLRSGKNWKCPGNNFGKNVWKKIQGVKNFGNEGEERFREILSCPPPKMRVAAQMPLQIPRPGAATDGTLENLKKFVADELKLLGKWTSPGGETKLFTSALVCLKWQSKTSKWITIFGSPNEVNDVIKQLKSTCEEAAMNSTTNSINVDENVDASNHFDPAEASVIELTGPESVPGISNQLNHTAPMPFNNEQAFIKDKLSCIEAEMKSLESKFLDKTLSLANDLNNLKEHCFENNSGYINGLRHENTSLKEENKTLKDRLETTRFALANLNTKVKDLENEEARLITSLKMLHQDYFQSNENGSNNKESAA